MALIMDLFTDYQDCITLIYELSQKQRDKGIRLFGIISNNIIEHPMERKWRYLHHDKIHNKFGKCDEFIQLMLHSGFKLITKPQKILIFNNKKIELLKLVTKSLTNYNQDEIVNINTVSKRRLNDRFQTSHRSRKQQQHHNGHLRNDKDIYYCICDNLLSQTTPDDIYEKNHQVFCDICMIELKGNDIIYHCSKGINSLQHKYNYDLCETCVSSRSQDSHNCNNLLRLNSLEQCNDQGLK